VIDAHVHIWRLGRNGCTWPTPDLAAIHRDHELTDVARTIAGTGVDRVVLVQSQESEDDASWLLARATGAPVVAGVVGWVDSAAIDIRKRIANLQRQGRLVGLRVMAQDRPAEWLADAALHAQFEAMADAGLALDLLVRPQHLAACADLAADFPTLRMIIDHCAKPHIAHEGLSAWRAAIAPAAEQPNLICKLSGLITEAAPGQPVETLAPYIEAMLDLFGSERLVWGSDWPVINLNGDYRTWLDFARSAIPAAHHDAVFGGNARAFYRLAA
jgi:L-fuconolactonase